MKAKTITLYQMTAYATGENLHVLLKDGQDNPPAVLGELTPVEVDPGCVHLNWTEYLSHLVNLMDRGWTVLGSHHKIE